MNLKDASIKEIGEELSRRGRPFLLTCIVEGDVRNGKHEITGRGTPAEAAVMMHAALDYIGEINGMETPKLPGMHSETIDEKHKLIDDLVELN